MSHFSVCVEIPRHRLPEGKINQNMIESVLDEILAPYWESTEDPQFLEFVDKDDECRQNFKTDTIDAAKMPDGLFCSINNREFTKKYRVVDARIEEKAEDGTYYPADLPDGYGLCPNRPVSELYSFEKYCTDYCGYKKDSAGHWGYYSNPNAMWDWFCIGGRFPGKLLVSPNIQTALPVIDINGACCRRPALDADGCQYVDGAFKKDVLWEKMQSTAIQAHESAYDRFKAAYESGNVQPLDQLASITDEGIAGWGTMLYLKGESLENFMARNGVGVKNTHILSTYAYVDRDGAWHASGDMGWFGLSSNDKPELEWHAEMQNWICGIDDDSYMVIVDCHI